MEERLIVAGFGGQGIIFMGKVLAYAGLMENKYVTCLPSYGPEMRGGTANCATIISERRIGSPLINNPSSFISMNRPSLDLFEPAVEPNGCILLNSSLIARDVKRTNVIVAKVQADTIAEELGNKRIANMVALGAYIAAKPIVRLESLIASLEKVLGDRGRKVIPLNEKAIRRGAKSVYKIRR